MSEHDHEEREPTRASRDEEVPESAEPDTGASDEQTPAQAAAADGSEEQIAKAEKAVASFNKRIDAIFGDNAPPLQCPRCDGLGRVWQVEEQQQQLRHPSNFVTCDECGGPGKVETGSTNPDYITTVCLPCGGRGYLTVTTPPENVTPITTPVFTGSGGAPSPVMGWMTPEGVFQPLGTPNASNG